MRNDKVILIIGNAVLGREANMRVQSIQGAVIDFTSLADNNDYLAAFFPQGFPGPDSRRNPAIFANRIEVVKGKGAEIVLRAIRDATEKVPYESVTEYTLRDGENFLRVKTTYTNSTEQDVSLVFADKLRMDMDIYKEASTLGNPKLAFMYNNWFHAAYGIYSPNGLLITEKPKVTSDPAAGLLVGFPSTKSQETSTITLRAGEKVEAMRYLLYGKDVADLQRQVMKFEKSDAVIATLKIADTNRKPIAGVFVTVYDKLDSLVSFAITSSSGLAEIPLTLGDYKFQAFKVGHDSANADFSIRKSATVIPVVMKPLTSLRFSVKEVGTSRPLPVKVEFKGINGHADPFLGSTKRAEGAANLYYAMTKNFEVPVPAGEYQITFSHGPEYETVKKQIEIKTGETKDVSAEIKRLFSSIEWIIADLHNHSARSGDNDADTRSRIINLAASGIEFAPATEHNRISSYSDEIKNMGLDKFLASAAGIELTGPTGVPSGPNHQNAFPLTIQDGKQGGGSPAIDGDVYTQMRRLYEYDSDKVKFVQHNHPGRGISVLYFDKDKDGVLDEGIGTRKFTDAIELQTSVYDILSVTSDEEKDKTKTSPVFYWLQMLNYGDRIFGTMTSDSHMIGERGGLRFVYVYSKSDDPSAIDAYEIASSAKKGHMVMSNGPFLRTNINGHVPGDDVKAMSDGLKMNIEVYANTDTEIERVQVLVNGRQDKTLNFTTSSHPKLFKAEPLQFKHTFPLTLDKDANVIVVATGKIRSQNTQLTTEGRSFPPIAVTNPLFIDANGDGFIPNKDTLGQPLPVATVGGSDEE